MHHLPMADLGNLLEPPQRHRQLVVGHPRWEWEWEWEWAVEDLPAHHSFPLPRKTTMPMPPFEDHLPAAETICLRRMEWAPVPVLAPLVPPQGWAYEAHPDNLEDPHPLTDLHLH